MPKPVKDIKSKLQTNSPNEHKSKSVIFNQRSVHITLKKKKKPENIIFIIRTACYVISLLILGVKCYLLRCPGSFPVQHSFPLIPFPTLFSALEITHDSLLCDCRPQWCSRGQFISGDVKDTGWQAEGCLYSTQPKGNKNIRRTHCWNHPTRSKRAQSERWNHTSKYQNGK